MEITAQIAAMVAAVAAIIAAFFAIRAMRSCSRLEKFLPRSDSSVRN